MNTRSAFPKGSHKSQYVTLIFGLQKARISISEISGVFKSFFGIPKQILSDSKGRGILKLCYSCNFKATDPSEGQCINGASAGEWGLKLPVYLRFIFAQSLTLRIK